MGLFSAVVELKKLTSRSVIVRRSSKDSALELIQELRSLAHMRHVGDTVETARRLSITDTSVLDGCLASPHAHMSSTAKVWLQISPATGPPLTVGPRTFACRDVPR